MSAEDVGNAEALPSVPPQAAAAQYGTAQDTAWKLQLWEAFEAAAGGEDSTCPRPIGCSGRLDNKPLPFLCPAVVVEGLGRLALPLTAVQCAEMATAAAEAPLAGGMSLQVEAVAEGANQADAAVGMVVVAAASLLQIGSNWQPLLQRAVMRAALDLRLQPVLPRAVMGAALDLRLQVAAASSMEARLRELVLRQGPCSACSLDQEGQAPGTFATLLVQLPCCGGCTGGGLEVQNLEQSFAYDFAQDSARGLHYTMHYSSCAQQQLGPLTAGRQLLLVYDLVWNGPPGTAPQPPGVSNAQQQLLAAAAAWKEAIAAGSMQLRLALPLKGIYPLHSDFEWDSHMYNPWIEPKSKQPAKRFGPPLTIDQLQHSDRSAAAALGACPALEVTLLLLVRVVYGDREKVQKYSKRKRKQPWGFDRGPRKRLAGAEEAWRHTPEPIENLPEDVDDGVDWDKVVEEEEARPPSPQGVWCNGMFIEDDFGDPVADTITERWLQLDGSESDLGEFLADRDFWHPAGRRVVWDLVQPQEEQVEVDHERDSCWASVMGRDGWTTPENSTRKYYRTYLMVSPRGYHHAAAAQGGPAAAQKQVLSLLAMALDGSRTLEDRGAAAAHAADTLQCVAWFVIQAAEGASKQQQVGPHLDAESVLSLLKATAGQLHAAKKAADVVADGQSQLPVVVPGLPALVAALSQLVAALAMLPGFIGGKSGTQVGKKHQVSKKLKPHLTQLMELIPLVGEEAAAAGLRQAVTQLSSSRKEDCMFAIRAAAAWPGVRQQMSGALQLSAMPEQALKLLGSVPSLLESQQQQVFAGLAQALQHSNTRDQAVRAAIDLNSGVPSWKRHPHLQAQAAAAVLAAISHLPPARQQDACGALSWANWAQWEAPLQQQLLQAARQVTAALVGGPGQGRQQQRTMAYLCQRTQMMDKQLQRQVLEPYIAHMLADGGAFAAQKVEDCLALSNLLLELPQPMVALHQLFAAALLQRGDAQEVLQVLAAVGAMREPEVRGLPSVRQLLEARMAWLSQEQQRLVAAAQQQHLGVQAALQRSPWLGWTQPNAVIKGNPQLENFLRSSSGSMTMDHIRKAKGMRAALERLLGTSSVAPGVQDSRQRPPALKGSLQTHTHSYQAEIERLGDGRQQLVVRKTMCWLAPIAGRSHEQLEHEMEDLNQLLQGGEGQQ